MEIPTIGPEIEWFLFDVKYKQWTAEKESISIWMDT